MNTMKPVANNIGPELTINGQSFPTEITQLSRVDVNDWYNARTKVGKSLTIVASGATAKEALDKLRVMVQQELDEEG